MKNMSVQDLSGVELAYAFAKAAKFEVLGSPGGPFALLSDDKRTIFVFGGTSDSIKLSSFEGNVADMAMQTAMDLGANLNVENRVAKCCIGQQCATGESYVQALMRAVILDDAVREKN